MPIPPRHQGNYIRRKGAYHVIAGKPGKASFPVPRYSKKLDCEKSHFLVSTALFGLGKSIKSHFFSPQCFLQHDEFRKDHNEGLRALSLAV